jgi:hypothetical protein
MISFNGFPYIFVTFHKYIHFPSFFGVNSNFFQSKCTLHLFSHIEKSLFVYQMKVMHSFSHQILLVYVTNDDIANTFSMLC